MSEYPPRLGDLVDDHCPRCRLLLNHAIASMVSGQVAKVLCQTCYTEHAYHHGEARKKKAGPRTTLFDQVLSKISPAGPDGEAEPPAPKKPPSSPAAPEPEPPASKKKTAAPARYIARHGKKPSPGNR